MDQLLPLPVVLPLLAAAGLAALGPVLRPWRRARDAASIAVGAVVTVILLVIMVRTAGGDQVYWFAVLTNPCLTAF